MRFYPTGAGKTVFGHIFPLCFGNAFYRLRQFAAVLGICLPEIAMSGAFYYIVDKFICIMVVLNGIFIK